MSPEVHNSMLRRYALASQPWKYRRASTSIRNTLSNRTIKMAAKRSVCSTLSPSVTHSGGTSDLPRLDSHVRSPIRDFVLSKPDDEQFKSVRHEVPTDLGTEILMIGHVVCFSPERRTTQGLARQQEYFAWLRWSRHPMKMQQI